jgi:hypothetical protein
VTTCGGDEIGASYIRSTIIPDEVYEMVRNLELSCLKQQEISHEIEIMEMKQTCHSNGCFYEPMRCISESAPPKRFYRSFWRSLTQRIVQRKTSVALGRDAKPPHRNDRARALEAWH